LFLTLTVEVLPLLPKFACAKLSKMKVSPNKFIKEVKAELLKVTWPTKKEVVRLTSIVVAISLFVGLYIGLLDFIFTKLIQLIIRR